MRIASRKSLFQRKPFLDQRGPPFRNSATQQHKPMRDFLAILVLRISSANQKKPRKPQRRYQQPAPDDWRRILRWVATVQRTQKRHVFAHSNASNLPVELAGAKAEAVAKRARRARIRCIMVILVVAWVAWLQKTVNKESGKQCRHRGRPIGYQPLKDCEFNFEPGRHVEVSSSQRLHDITSDSILPYPVTGLRPRDWILKWFCTVQVGSSPSRTLSAVNIKPWNRFTFVLFVCLFTPAQWLCRRKRTVSVGTQYVLCASSMLPCIDFVQYYYRKPWRGNWSNE